MEINFSILFYRIDKKIKEIRKKTIENEKKTVLNLIEQDLKLLRSQKNCSLEKISKKLEENYIKRRRIYRKVIGIRAVENKKLIT